LPVYGPPEKDLNQGDLIAEVPFISRRRRDCEAVVLAGLVTTNSCDLDKYTELRDSLTRNQRLAWPVTVAPLYGLEDLDRAAAGDVRAHRHRRYFYLPREAPQPEMMADLWLQQPVPLSVITRLNRLATLSDEWLARLWLHAFITFSRRDPKDVFVGGTLSAP
jgi:hypothetical protein